MTADPRGALYNYAIICAIAALKRHAAGGGDCSRAVPVQGLLLLWSSARLLEP
jgi:hypothetical protein